MIIPHPYRMSISLNVLNHLGIGLYSNIPAVLSEIVANAWDADASLVQIDVDAANSEIRIWDDGQGMTRRDINDRYLKVGYNKRETEGSVTPIKHRPVMGRKGIGKLSVFSIANIIEVHSVKNQERNGLRMDAAKIQEKIKMEASSKDEVVNENQDFTYYPIAVPPENINIEQGTQIILRGLNKDIARTGGFLRKRLARRFSVIAPQYDFRVIVDGEEITAKERDYFSNFEFVWYFGDDNEHMLKQCSNLKKSVRLGNIVDANLNYNIHGWIGTINEQKNISKDDNINAIILFAHGKLIHEDILSTYKEGGIYSKYIIGEIDADFMDLDDRPDIVTSNRQSVREDDERFEKLKTFIWEQLKLIQTQWADFRREGSLEKATENPIVKEWYSKWRGDNRKSAEKLFQKIESLPLPDPASKVEFYKAGLLAFEKLALVDALSVLDDLETEEHFEAVLALFKDIDDLEAAHYHEIVKGRIQVVEKFASILPGTKERVLQEYLFEHLWLLDPSWERAASDARIEEAVGAEFDIVTANLTDEEKKGRIDIRYCTAAGKHIIVELKRYERKVTVTELAEQIGKYISALDKCLKIHRPNERNEIECIVIIGDHPVSPGANAMRILNVYNARYMLYDELINQTLTNYKDYLEKQKDVSKLSQMLEKLTTSTSTTI